jgi:hypothetical protein
LLSLQRSSPMYSSHLLQMSSSSCSNLRSLSFIPSCTLCVCGLSSRIFWWSLVLCVCSRCSSSSHLLS